MKLIPKEVIEGFEKLEKYMTIKSPRETAKAYISIPSTGLPLQKLVFMPFPDKLLLKTISMLGLDKNFDIKPGISISENQQFWTRSLAPLGSYVYPNERTGLKNMPYDIAMIFFDEFYNGIDMKKAKRLLKYEKSDYLRSVAVTLGGDVWKNSLLDRKNGNTKKEYTYDTLGLRLLEICLEQPHLKLSELMQEANRKENVQFAQNYKDSSYWKICQECFAVNKNQPLSTSFNRQPFNYIANTLQKLVVGELDYSRID